MKTTGAVQMGLVVNPEGPNSNRDPEASAIDISETFGRMAMNDEETVALIAGGHTFRKGHGAAIKHLCGARTGGPTRGARNGWKTHEIGKGPDTIASGLEELGLKTIVWDNNYFENLFGYNWEQSTSPAGLYSGFHLNVLVLKKYPMRTAEIP